MKIIWLFLCLTPTFHCLPKEINHNLQRRDVSELLKKDPEINLSNYQRRENETPLRTDSGRSLHHTTGIQQSDGQKGLNLHPSRAYLPPTQDTLHKSSHPNSINSNNLDHQTLSNDYSSIKHSNPQINFIPQNQVSFSGSPYSLQNPVHTSNGFSYSPSSNPHQNKIDNLFPFTYNALNSLSQLDHFNKQSLFRQNNNGNLETPEHNIKLHSYNNGNVNSQETQFSYPRTVSNGVHLLHPQQGGASPLSADGININSQSFDSSSPDSVLANYDFKYEVAVNQPGPDFGHEEKRTGDLITGQYNVLLPDGRRQTVKYEADDTGFRPQIFYDGRSVLLEPFPTKDPLSVQNVNTIVTDLLNSDLKRTRDQKSPSLPQYPVHQVNYLHDDIHGSHGYDSNANFGRGLTTATGNIQDPSPFHTSQQSNHLNSEINKQTSNLTPYHASYPGLLSNSQTYSNPEYGTLGQTESTKFVKLNNRPSHILSTNIPQSENSFEGRLLSLGQTQQKNQGFLLPQSFGLVYSQSYANSGSQPIPNQVSELERNGY